MANHRLFKALTHFSPEEAERVFGDEAALNPPDHTLKRAAVKRVAIFAEAFLPKVDGVSKTAFLTMKYLKQTGREVLIFAPDIAPTSIGDTRIIPMPSLGIPVAPETRMALPHPTVVHQLNEFKPDVIHMFSPMVLSASGMVYGRQNRIPVVANYQTDIPGYCTVYGYPLLASIAREWMRFVHNHCHLTLVPSNWTMRELRDQGYRRMRRWGRGVHGKRFNPARRSSAMRARLLGNSDPNSLLCLYVGRVAQEKQIDLLLEVARTPGVALAVVGDGAQREELERLFAGTNANFTGYLYGDELASAYASADVFMFTGGVETFGQVVQEAQASGLPTVIINQGGIVDLVTDGLNGYVCPPDPEAFAAAARRLRDDPSLLQRMGAAARTTAERNPWENILAQLEDYYDQALRLNERLNRWIPAQPNLLASLLNRNLPVKGTHERAS